ncbi:MFS transporter, partial [candidate division KSB1 bacterium]|nr:MFS transporter [candidate division KSB1 bacterium]
MFKNHPRGLVVLFFTEMWERFGFYLMLGIFTLYMIDKTGGKGFSDVKAADIYGTYLALVYLTPFIGGLLADKILGYRLAISIGGILMGLGYLGLAFPGDTVFYASLLLIIIGNGFFKPNISSLVGKLYDHDPYKKLKDSGFNIFYMGINIGAFICNFIAAYLRIKYGWGYAFAAAGIGMFIGLTWFWTGQRHVRTIDMIDRGHEGNWHVLKLLLSVFLPAIAGGLVGWFLPGMLLKHPLFLTHSNDAFLFASIPIVIYYCSLWIKAPKEDKSQLAALLTVFSVVILFWAIFHQNGSALTIYAERHTIREVHGSLKNHLSDLGLTQEVSVPESV